MNITTRVRSALGAVGLIALALALVAAAGASTVQRSSSTARATAGTLTVGLAEEPDALDPTLARTFVGRIVFLSLCEKLYDINAKLEIVPQLAASLPKVSGDGKTVTIALRKGIKFNDGTPFNAAAVKTSLDRHKGLARSARASELTPVDSVTTSGSSTVVLHLSAPFAPLTSLLADRSGMIMSPTALNGSGAFASNPVCVGPFSFVSRTAGDRIVLKKSDQYYAKSKVKLAGIVYRIVNEPSAMAANLRSHDIDVADRLASTNLPTIKGDSSLTVIKATTLGYQGLTINIGNKNGLRKPYENVGTPLAKHRGLREALELSLDRKVINKVVFGGTVLPDCSPVSPVQKFWRDPKLKCPGRNIARAKKLVAQSGERTPITIKVTIGTDTVAARLGQVLQAQAKDAGFNLELVPTEFTTALNRADAGQFDVFAVGFSGRVDPDGTNYGFVHTGGSLNDSGYSSGRVDRLLDAARTNTNPNKRRAIYNQAFAIVLQDRPLIYLWHPQNFTGVSKKVKGVRVYGDGLIRAAFASK
ncbi:MAG: ABC transporter substrate-binding protein [Thermoleophilia bacterium]